MQGTGNVPIGRRVDNVAARRLPMTSEEGLEWMRIDINCSKTIPKGIIYKWKSFIRRRIHYKLTCTIIFCFGKTKTKPKKYFVLE